MALICLFLPAISLGRLLVYLRVERPIDGARGIVLKGRCCIELTVLLRGSLATRLPVVVCCPEWLLSRIQIFVNFKATPWAAIRAKSNIIMIIIVLLGCKHLIFRSVVIYSHRASFSTLLQPGTCLLVSHLLFKPCHLLQQSLCILHLRLLML